MINCASLSLHRAQGVLQSCLKQASIEIEVSQYAWFGLSRSTRLETYFDDSDGKVMKQIGNPLGIFTLSAGLWPAVMLAHGLSYRPEGLAQPLCSGSLVVAVGDGSKFIPMRSR